MISAEIITDSISPDEIRLTTFKLVYPRFIHSELMTHRAFSRNAASSRAIPFHRMVEMIEKNPAMPVYWGSSQKGMQSGPEIDENKRGIAIDLWLYALKHAKDAAKSLDELGIHKSISNRLLEPFAHMTTIVTATEFNNFFALRAHPDAQPEFQELAYQMLEQYLNHIPTRLNYGEWHLPFVHQIGIFHPDLTMADLIKTSVARCARVSYANFKESSLEEDIALHDRLMNSGHWSPFEHVAQSTGLYSSRELQGNFRGGWTQYRKHFEGENKTDVNLPEILERRTKQ